MLAANHEARCYIDLARLMVTGVQGFCNNPVFSDITVVCPDGRQLRCHQLVLAACSKRFATVLKQGEFAGQKLPVQGVDSAALEILITSFYAGECPLTLSSAPAVHDAASKLEVQGLPPACEQFVGAALTPMNVCSVLDSSLTHKVSRLVDLCIEFAMKRLMEVVQSPQLREASLEVMLKLTSELYATQQLLCMQAIGAWLTHADADGSRLHLGAVLATNLGVSHDHLAAMVDSADGGDISLSQPGKRGGSKQQHGATISKAGCGDATGSSGTAGGTGSGSGGMGGNGGGGGGLPNGLPTLSVQVPGSSSYPLLHSNGVLGQLSNGLLQSNGMLSPGAQALLAAAGSGRSGLTTDAQLRLLSSHLQLAGDSGFDILGGRSLSPVALFSPPHAHAQSPVSQLRGGSGGGRRSAAAGGGHQSGGGAGDGIGDGSDGNGRGKRQKMATGGRGMSGAVSDELDDDESYGEGRTEDDDQEEESGRPAGGAKAGRGTAGGPSARGASGVMQRQRSNGVSSKGLCHVDGCNADLHGLRDYHLRYKICEYHLKIESVEREGVLQRFCQQCGRFHVLSDFDGTRRSCRAMLARHNQRRAKKSVEVATLITNAGS